jgi:hypothetical protein
MQIFTPYPDLKKSVSCLDPKRLGNQIYREAFTLIKGGWPNHPASKIWFPHKNALSKYCLFGLEELKKRGRNYPKWFKFYNECLDQFPDTGLPEIFGNEQFHLSHKSKLIFKNSDYYRPIFGPNIPDNLPYIWKI